MAAAPPDPVDAILERHGVRGPWGPLPATGIANRIYATRDVVLRVGTDHPEAVCDARTESVAAPVARRAGIRVPRLLAFVDSDDLSDRPYSLWERIHGETIGLFAPDPRKIPETWREIGRELARLHERVTECQDPNGWLDDPERGDDQERQMAERLAAADLDAATTSEVERLVAALRPRVDVETATRFLHNDLHAMNLMCARDGMLLALLDWGDAGWGDPVFDLALMPLLAMPFALEGYREVAPHLLGEDPEARLLWDRIDYALAFLFDDPPNREALPALLAFVETAGREWSR